MCNKAVLNQNDLKALHTASTTAIPELLVFCISLTDIEKVQCIVYPYFQAYRSQGYAIMCEIKYRVYGVF